MLAEDGFGAANVHMHRVVFDATPRVLCALAKCINDDRKVEFVMNKQEILTRGPYNATNCAVFVAKAAYAMFGPSTTRALARDIVERSGHPQARKLLEYVEKYLKA